MRSGSTALSSVLCSHPDISGYGETHVTYGHAWSSGALILNQWRRGSWRPGARFLFDKVLHNAYDENASEFLTRGQTILLARRPAPTIASIVHLAEKMKLREWRDAASAADYYHRRMDRLLRLWPSLDPARRVALTHAQLTNDPDALLPRLGARLGLCASLRNTYVATWAGSVRGGGDPLMAAQQSSIVRSEPASSHSVPEAIDLPASRIDALEAIFADYRRLCVGLLDGSDASPAQAAVAAQPPTSAGSELSASRSEDARAGSGDHGEKLNFA